MVLIGAAVLYKQGISDEPLNPGEPPAYFCYEGYEYVYRGYTLDSRPYDAIYIGKIVNGGNFVKEDMKGNVEGYAYMVPGDDTKAYFKWKEWDIEVDGKEPILIFQKEEKIL